jgi:hypothetical protein
MWSGLALSLGLLILADTAFADSPSTAKQLPDTRTALELLDDVVHGFPFQVSDLAAACCKTCRKGKACGDSCISRDKTCRKGPGCACDAPAHEASRLQ